MRTDFSLALKKVYTCFSVISAIFQRFLTLENCQGFREHIFKERFTARRNLRGGSPSCVVVAQKK